MFAILVYFAFIYRKQKISEEAKRFYNMQKCWILTSDFGLSIFKLLGTLFNLEPFSFIEWYNKIKKKLYISENHFLAYFRNIKITFEN